MLHVSTLRPPIITDIIRIVPKINSNHPQVCLRLELLGCQLKSGKFKCYGTSSVAEHDPKASVTYALPFAFYAVFVWVFFSFLLVKKFELFCKNMRLEGS